MIALQEIAARVATCKANAQAVMADLDSLVAELPEWREDADPKGLEYALMEVRGELEVAAGGIDGAIDYLTPRADDDPDPDCCAHRRLQALIAEGVQS